ncbi:MAG: SbcC/MukB-like Walker B domain-containing protein [Termitinemataceae bacterium]|nr:MAG: SbcC/MukB-like Walker B domain-containing protein [Termitinemataceae bacterium]
MITLERVRLVCWHYFDDIVIDIGNRCLFGGDNGSGKSTIIDAIQYVMAADLRKAHFNAAAGGKKSGRDLEGYVRCKLGSDNTEYLRGDAVSHVMLEFSDTDKGFSAGVCVEAFTDGKLSEHFWLAVGIGIDNINVNETIGTKIAPLSFRKFRDVFFVHGVDFFDSKRQYQKEFTAKLGVWRRMTDFNPYLEAFTRSVSFTPMVSVDKFVCDYILEDRPVDISAMKMNLESYKEAEREAKAAIIRIDALKKICAKAVEWQSFITLITKQEYLKIRAMHDIAEKEKINFAKQIEALKEKLKSVEDEITSVEKSRIELEAEKSETEAALAANNAHQLYRRLQEKLERLNFEIGAEAKKVLQYNTLRGQIEALLDRKLSNNTEHDIEAVQEGEADARRKKDIAAQKKAEVSTLLQDAITELEDLQHGMPRYPQAPVTLKKALTDAGISAHFLADTAEVIDEAWEDAAEGWLNTLRFAVLVDPDDFQKALEIYNSLPRSVGGAFLPNLAKMRDTKPKNGSLALHLKTDSPYAKIYVDYILGNVICADIKTLKDYSKAVTKECMTYSSFTASRIREDVYSRHYLGQKARNARLEFLLNETQDLKREKEILQNEEIKAGQHEEIFKRAYRSLLELIHLAPAIEALKKLEVDKKNTKSDLSIIDTSGFEKLENKKKHLTAILHEADEKKTNLNRSIGETENALTNANDSIGAAEEKFRLAYIALSDFSNSNSALMPDCEAYALERMKSTDIKTILSNYEAAIKGTLSRKDKIEKEYHSLVQIYDRDFNALLSFEPAEYIEVERLLQRLENSQLPQYREKISKARHDAEREFKDHFISRLNEFIEDARDSFNEINATLELLSFGRDQYTFSLTERTERRGQIGIVRKAAEIPQLEDGSLFSQFDDPQELKAIENLFESILNANLDSPTLRSICDYRTYFNYDIKIRDIEKIDAQTGKPVVSSLSKVLREKSGGEAQTPYYVAIAASFFRFFKNKPEDTVRLVMFDEAFNRMDDERIAKILKFYRELNLQIVSAVPTEKIEAMQPYMDRTNLVIRHGSSVRVRNIFDKTVS